MKSGGRVASDQLRLTAARGARAVVLRRRAQPRAARRRPPARGRPPLPRRVDAEGPRGGVVRRGEAAAAACQAEPLVEASRCSRPTSTPAPRARDVPLARRPGAVAPPTSRRRLRLLRRRRRRGRRRRSRPAAGPAAPGRRSRCARACRRRVGAVRGARRGHVASPAAPPPRVRARRRPRAPPAHSGEFDGEIRQLQELLKKMKRAEPLRDLRADAEGRRGPIKIAYFKLAKLYHPDTVPPGAPEALAKVKADIFARIGEANRTLSTRTTRADYIAELEAGGSGGDKIDVAQILAAEEMFQRGRSW